MPTLLEPEQASLRSPLDDWNQASLEEAIDALLILCGSRRWAAHLAACRPYDDHAHLHHAATNLWFLLDEADWLEAFACHPRIGEAPAGASAFTLHAQAEQGATQATLAAPTAQALARGNQLYEQRFGFLYIVFASGRAAPELLALLEARLTHDRITELHEAARQQHRITDHRMRKWLAQHVADHKQQKKTQVTKQP